MRVRRLVTGVCDGRSVVVEDAPLEPVTISTMPGREFFTVWGSDAPVTLPTLGAPPPSTVWFPPPGGFRFGFTVIPPNGAMTGGDEQPDVHDHDEIERKLPGLLAPYDPDTPGMHTTDTIDFIFLVEGELVLELDDGQRQVLRAGDCLVQNGTSHRWHNLSDGPAVITYALVGAARENTIGVHDLT